MGVRDTKRGVEELTSDIPNVSEDATRDLDANGIIRIDYIITHDAEGNEVINMLEVNTTPGMTTTSFIPQQVRAAGLDIKDVLTEIIENQF